MLLPTLYYSSETLIWFEYDKPRIKAVELYFLACTWGIRGINWVKNVVQKIVRGACLDVIMVIW